MQQFLYTFRYFCTPHDFLHFLLDCISSSLARYASPTAPSTSFAGCEGQVRDVVPGDPDKG